MKKNFVVSCIKELWVKDAKELFTPENYIAYLLKQNNEDKNYTNIEVGEFLRTDRESTQAHIDFIQEKYEKYVPILTKRLNKIHNKSYSERFWKKCLSMALLRYLTFFHYLFTRCEEYFNPDEHTCQILSPESYYTPVDFEDHRTVFQATHFGQEQIFSHYVNLFYPGQFKNIDYSYETEKPAKQNFFRMFLKGIKNNIETRKQKNVKIGIYGCLFAQNNLEQLQELSRGGIDTIKIENHNQSMANKPADHKKRCVLGEFEEDFDRFDKFFFSTLPYCLPKAFIQNFERIYKLSVKKAKAWPNMKYIVSEYWISDTYASIALAILREQGIRHLYNEHNAIFHSFIGNMVKNQAALVDKYISFGWSDDEIPNLIPKASLFSYKLNKIVKKKYELLYVSYTSVSKTPTYGGYYGTSDVNAPRIMGFARTFMSNLSLDTLKRISYRGYPKDYTIKRFMYDKESYLEDYLKHCTIVSSSIKGETCREQMLKSRLVIADYKSTAYLEALHMNIPIVFFWNKEGDYLEEKYSDLYQPLVDAGICQTDPVRAAEFIEKIKDNPEEWWNSEDVQKKKDEFLNRNFQNPQIMIEYLLGLAQ